MYSFVGELGDDVDTCKFGNSCLLYRIRVQEIYELDLAM